MKRAFSLALIHLFVFAAIQAQSPTVTTDAANPVQLSQPESATPPPAVRELKISAGTPLEIETAFTVNSQYVRPEELISFRVLVPVRVDGVTLIEKYSLVTGRVVQAKRGGHWGKAGKLSGGVQVGVAVDVTGWP